MLYQSLFPTEFDLKRMVCVSCKGSVSVEIKSLISLAYLIVVALIKVKWANKKLKKKIKKLKKLLIERGAYLQSNEERTK